MTLRKLSPESVADFRGKIILAVGAHPDDIDIGCAGTVARCKKEGGQVYYLVLTDGSKGSENSKISNEKLIKLRHKEQQKAAEGLGVNYVFFLDFIDGELENTAALRKQIVKIIRHIKPTTVILWDPTLYYDENRQIINHRDHRVGGEATLDAVYPFARNARTYPELLEEGLPPHFVEEVLLVNFSYGNYFIDISSTIDKKITAISCHKSQFKDVEKFGARIKEMSKLIGQKNKPKMKYAERFIRISLGRPA